ncbi:MAG TPA: hypothetical protein VMV41_05765, partial [Cellulomonadaceae bacterium]|nr:hypothetical protein [Cellulomonadaceae bacterium]
MARQFLAYTEPPAGAAGTRVYLDTLAFTANLIWRHAYPGGPMSLDMDIDLPPEFSHDALLPGRVVTVLNGAEKVWVGRLDNPTRGNPWKLQATGLGSLATSFRATAAS